MLQVVSKGIGITGLLGGLALAYADPFIQLLACSIPLIHLCFIII